MKAAAETASVGPADAWRIAAVRALVNRAQGIKLAARRLRPGASDGEDRGGRWRSPGDAHKPLRAVVNLAIYRGDVGQRHLAVPDVAVDLLLADVCTAQQVYACKTLLNFTVAVNRSRYGKHSSRPASAVPAGRPHTVPSQAARQAQTASGNQRQNSSAGHRILSKCVLQAKHISHAATASRSR